MVVVPGMLEGKELVGEYKRRAGTGENERDRRARDAGDMVTRRINGKPGMEIKERAVRMRDRMTEARKVAPVADIFVWMNGENRAVFNAVNEGLRVRHGSIRKDSGDRIRDG